MTVRDVREVEDSEGCEGGGVTVRDLREVE